MTKEEICEEIESLKQERKRTISIYQQAILSDHIEYWDKKLVKLDESENE